MGLVLSVLLEGVIMLGIVLRKIERWCYLQLKDLLTKQNKKKTHTHTHTHPYTIMVSSVDHVFLLSNRGHTSLTFSG